MQEEPKCPQGGGTLKNISQKGCLDADVLDTACVDPASESTSSGQTFLALNICHTLHCNCGFHLRNSYFSPWKCNKFAPLLFVGFFVVVGGGWFGFGFGFSLEQETCSL